MGSKNDYFYISLALIKQKSITNILDNAFVKRLVKNYFTENGIFHFSQLKTIEFLFME